MPFRKPLVVVAPKKLLRFKGACSDIEDFADNTSSQLLFSQLTAIASSLTPHCHSNLEGHCCHSS